MVKWERNQDDMGRVVRMLLSPRPIDGRTTDEMFGARSRKFSAIYHYRAGMRMGGQTCGRNEIFYLKLEVYSGVGVYVGPFTFILMVLRDLVHRACNSRYRAGHAVLCSLTINDLYIFIYEVL